VAALGVGPPPPECRWGRRSKGKQRAQRVRTSSERWEHASQKQEQTEIGLGFVLRSPATCLRIGPARKRTSKGKQRTQCVRASSERWDHASKNMVMMNDALTLFSFRGPFREKNLSIPAAVGSSPSMPRLVFWPLFAPRRWRFSRLCAQLLWCELYDMIYA